MKNIDKSKHYSDRDLLSPLKKGKLTLPKGYSIPSTHGHKTTFKTIRKSEYRGKRLRVETTYKITIDNTPLTSHIMVLDDGTVHCHDFPNYSFTSAMDMARKIIDSMVEFDAPDNELSAKNDKHGGYS